jgi:hypothetical protein
MPTHPHYRCRFCGVVQVARLPAGKPSRPRTREDIQEIRIPANDLYRSAITADCARFFLSMRKISTRKPAYSIIMMRRGEQQR